MNRTEALEKLRTMILEQVRSGKCLTEDTLPSIPLLIQINQSGLITTNSQPGGKYGVQIQRAYLDGLASKETALKLYELNRRNLIVHIRRCSWSEPTRESRIPVTILKSHAHNNECSCCCPQGPPGKKSWFCTWTAPHTSYYICDSTCFFPKRVNQVLRNYLYVVSIVDPVWGRKSTNPKNGLLKKVISALGAG